MDERIMWLLVLAAWGVLSLALCWLVTRIENAARLRQQTKRRKRKISRLHNKRKAG